MRSRLFEYTAAFACSLVRTGVVLALAAVAFSWTIGVVRLEGPHALYDGRSSEGSKAVVETTRLVMSVEPGRSCSEYSLEDEEGRELLRVTYGSKGFIVVNLGESFPLRPGFSAGLDGSYDLAVKHEGVDHQLRIRPGGASGFEIASRSQRIGDPLFEHSVVGRR